MYTLSLFASVFCFVNVVYANERPQEILEQMTLDQKISQIIMSYPPLSKTDPVDVGAIILTGNLMRSEEQIVNKIQSLSSRATIPLFFAADVEGGKLNKFSFDLSLKDLPPNSEISTIESAQKWGEEVGTAMNRMGLNMALAPVLDVADEGLMYTSNRSFRGSTEQVSALGRSYSQGLALHGIAAMGKHWPGYGNVEENTDHHFVVTERSREDIEKDKKAFVDVGTNLTGVMLANVGYSSYDNKPAILSKTLVAEAHAHGWLTITDDLSIKALSEATNGDQEEVVRQAFLAGNDFLLTTAPLDWEKSLDYRGIIKELIVADPSYETILDDAVLRILQAKEKSRLLGQVPEIQDRDGNSHGDREPKYEK